jgi:cytochrome c-type biogenesis protein CcmH
MNHPGLFALAAALLVLVSAVVLLMPAMRRPVDAEAPALASGRRGRFVVLVLAVLVIGPALAWMAMGGGPRLARLAAGADQPVVDTAPAGGPTEAQIVAMVDRLAEKLKSRPDDLDGWLMLARSSMMLGRYEQAADAWGRASDLQPDNAQLLVDQADALAMAQGQRLAGKPMELVDRALARDPSNLKALVMAAAGATERGDHAAAIPLWERALRQVPPESDVARELADYLERARRAARAPAR